MSIAKAVLLTLLITLIEGGIKIISFVGYDQSGLSKGFEHLYGITIILCRLIAYSTVFYLFWKKDLIPNELKFPNFKPKILLYLLLMTLGLRFVGEPFWDFSHIFRSAELTFYSFDGFDPKFIYRSISILLIAPILEELFFRKFLITKLLQKYSKITALAVSAGLFSAIHWETLNNLIPAFIFGISSGIIYINTKRISYLILLHFLYNFFSLTITVKSAIYSKIILWLNFGILYWSLFFFGIFIILFALHRISNTRSAITSIQ